MPDHALHAKGILAVRRIQIRDVATALDMHPNYVGEVLNGRCPISRKFRRNLARFLDLSEDSVFPGPDASEAWVEPVSA